MGSFRDDDGNFYWKQHGWGLGRIFLLAVILVALTFINYGIDRFKKSEAGGSEGFISDGEQIAQLSSVRDYSHIALDGATTYFRNGEQSATAMKVCRETAAMILGLLFAWMVFRDPHAGKRGLVEMCGYVVLRVFATCMFWETIPAGAVVSSSGNNPADADTDFFFSGHTAMTAIAVIEIWRWYRSYWLTAITFLILVFVVLCQLILRAHYFSDVFCAIFVAATLCMGCQLIELKWGGIDIAKYAYTVGGRHDDLDDVGHAVAPGPSNVIAPSPRGYNPVAGA